ncbi:hypothetical protein BH23VER1_BH23VER1_04680 [soil metagenome]
MTPTVTLRRLLLFITLACLAPTASRADYYEDFLFSARPLAYWSLNDAPGTPQAFAPLDNTGPTINPLATYGAGVSQAQSAFGANDDLTSGGGFPGFDAGNVWVGFNGSAEGTLSDLLVRSAGGPGGMSDGVGSVSFWINVGSTAQQIVYYGSNETGGDGFGGQNELHVNLSASGQIQFFNRFTDIGGGTNRTLTSGGTYADGSWHHVAATWDIGTNTMALYIDGGAFEGGETLTTDMAGSTQNVPFSAHHRFGRAGVTTTRLFDGRADALALWDRALSANEVRAQFLAATTGDLDSDSDNLPDAFEIAFFGEISTQTGADDSDLDGLTNSQELVLGTFPNAADSDGDGLLDGHEDGGGTYVSATMTGTSPILADTDGDGLPDDVETATGIFVSANDTGTDPNQFDTDGDGQGDGFEIANNTDPNDGGDFTAPILGGGFWEVTTVRDQGNDTDTYQEAILNLNPNITGGTGAIQGDIRNVSFEPVINFTTGSPAGNFGVDEPFDTFGFVADGTEPATARISLLVTGEIFIPEDDTYTFVTNNDDGVRLRIGGLDGTIVIFDNTNHAPANFFGSVQLTAGLHPVQLVYFNGSGDGSLELAVYRGRGEVTTIDSVLDFELLQPFDPSDNESPADGIPDQWEMFYFGNLTTAGVGTDFDGDGLSDRDEFTHRSDPTEADTDGDGLSDRDEIAGSPPTDPRRADTDGDGLTDAQELLLTTNPTLFDTDGDGFGDGIENAQGTDPLDPDDFPGQGLILFVTSGDNGAELEFTDPTSRFFGNPNDFGFLQVLREAGYGVQVRDQGVNGFTDGEGGPDVAAANAADLVIISRNNNSGNYLASNAAWNSITTPVLSLSAYVTRGSRMAWLPSDQEGVAEFDQNNWRISPGASGEPAFAGLGLADGQTFDTSIDSSSINTGVTDVGNGMRVAVAANSGNNLAFARWSAGVPFYSGGETPAGERVYFSAGAGGTNPAPGLYNLTGTGRTIFLNIIDDLVPDAPTSGPYGAWIAGFRAALFPLTGGATSGELPGADPDRDGLTNLEELVFGLDPTVNSRTAADPNSANAPTLVTTGGMVALVYTLVPGNLDNNGTSASAISVGGQQSDDLSIWLPLAPTPVTGNTFMLVIPDGDPARFGRLEITVPD